MSYSYTSFAPAGRQAIRISPRLLVSFTHLTTRLAFCILLFSVSIPAYAQPASCCQSLRTQGQTAFNNKDYAKAIIHWTNGKGCSDAAKCPDLNALIQKARTEQQKQKDAAATAECRRQAEALANILNTYKGKKFDDLIKTSSKESVQRDRQLVGNSEIKQTLDDLEKYFNAQELFSKKFEFNSVKNAQNQVNQINQQSELVTNLKDKLENFKIFNDGLKGMIEKINNLDKKESVKGMGEQIEKQKYNKILSELTSYIFSYDFNFTDYPYLSGIIIEIIKRKQPNADSDISDLLNKF